MTYDYHIEFLTQFDRDYCNDRDKKPITFHTHLHIGDIIQLTEEGEFHLVRLITHSPQGATLWLSGKGEDIKTLLLGEPEFTHPDPSDASSDSLDVVLTWQTRTRYPFLQA